MTNFVRFLKNEEGVAAIEYGLLAALIAIAAVGAMTILGADLVDIFTSIGNTLTGVNTTIAR